jgi:hypothetical protein
MYIAGPNERPSDMRLYLQQNRVAHMPLRAPRFGLLFQANCAIERLN